MGALIGGSALPIYQAAEWEKYRSTKKENRLLSEQAMQQGRLLNMQYSMQSAMMAQQAQFHSIQADALHQQAEFAKRHANTLASFETQKAAIAQQEDERELERIAKIRRLHIGAGLVAYAGNGVLLEARDDSAPAMWERDEMADLAVEMVLMRHETDKEVWGFLRNSAAIRLQGEQDAYALRLQALSANLDAANAMMSSGIATLQAASALTQAYNEAKLYRSRTKAAKTQMYATWTNNFMNTSSNIANSFSNSRSMLS
jgi:hypothetical protein